MNGMGMHVVEFIAFGDVLTAFVNNQDMPHSLGVVENVMQQYPAIIGALLATDWLEWRHRQRSTSKSS